MIFKNKRLVARLQKAQKKFSKKDYESAHRLLVSILNAQPDEVMAPLVHASLAETEFHCGNFGNSRYYASLFIEHCNSIPESTRTTEQVAMLEMARWYRTASLEQQRR